MKGRCVENCGACCDPVISIHGPFEVATARAWDTEMVWLRDNTTHIRGGAGMRKFRAHMADPSRPLVGSLDTGEMSLNYFFYRCRHYDEETRRCTNYANRPPMCRDYPWHDDPPDPDVALPKTCGYLVDVGIEPVPVSLPTRRRRD